jgi:tetratricopeptide (TPR) repeat protein
MVAAEQQAVFRAAYAEALAALRTGRAASAERQLRALQAASPGEVNSLHLLGQALLAQGKVATAIEALERTVAAAPEFAPARTDLARAYRRDGRLAAAREELRRVVSAAPGLDRAWLAYGDVLVDLEQYADARVAYDRARLSDPYRARLEEASAALTANNLKTAETIFRAILKADASHVGALCGLAAVSQAAGSPRDSERLLRHALVQSAHLPLAWRGLSQALLDRGRLVEAEAAIQKLLKIEPENTQNWVTLGTIATQLMRQDTALAAYQEAARLKPAEVRLRLTVGHVLKTLGRRQECEAAYKACLELDPNFGEAYWSLADLKTYVFADAEIAAMQALLATEHGAAVNEAQVHFALGRACEQRADYGRAFEHYVRGNALRRRGVSFDIAKFENKTARVVALFDRHFFAERVRAGCPDGAPIFIVGLPRSGSTLVEQILASHSGVEGTMELHNILRMVREFDHMDARHDAYPESVRAASAEDLTALGRRFIEETAPLRSGRSRFIDKMPNNFSHIGLIHAILPNATIIDVRRHPMDACFSTFKQNFAEGQSFSYDLEDLGRYYRAYLELMDHWDEVLPGKVLHIRYEELVREPEANIRRLLAHCALPFEAACLDFHATKRSVRTASAEQVRQPLYSSAVGYWQNFAGQLEPLRLALGDCLARFEAH